jgi:hypothetical protein
MVQADSEGLDLKLPKLRSPSPKVIPFLIDSRSARILSKFSSNQIQSLEGVLSCMFVIFFQPISLSLGIQFVPPHTCSMVQIDLSRRL